MIEAVIFDLDGSMVDSMWVWKSIDIEYLGRFGIRLPEDLQASIGGKSFSETAVYFKERFGIPDEPQTIKEDWNRMAWEKYTHEVPLKRVCGSCCSIAADGESRWGSPPAIRGNW